MKQIWFKKNWLVLPAGACNGNTHYSWSNSFYGAGLYGRIQKWSFC